MKKKIILGMAVFGAGFYLTSCGDSSAGSGTVALYATDAPLDGASRVEVGIKQIRLEHTGTGLSCVVFAPQDPYRVDLTDLQGTMQLLDLSNCPEGEYNRLVVTMEKEPVEVIIDYNKDGTPEAYTCSLMDYEPNDHGHKPILPNRTQCNPDPSANECYIYVTGEVNVLANRTTDVALDFSVKDSDIEIDDSVSPPACTVSFKVYPLHEREMEDHMEKEGKEYEIKGVIAENSLDIDANTFQLIHNGMTFTVNYSDNIGTGIDQLLTLALGRTLTVEAECSDFDINTATCTAEEIEVKAEGTALNVDPAGMTLSIDFDGDNNGDINVQVSGEMEGDVQDGKWVELELTGYDESTDMYIADEVEEEHDKDHMK